MGLRFAGMFAFITASPFIYIQYFGIAAQHYAWLFALNIGGIMGVSFLNARLVSRLGSRRLLGFGAGVAACAGLALLLCAGFEVGGLPALVLCVLLFVSVTGLVAANSLASLMAIFPRQAGAAAGLAVSMQFGLGTLASALVGALYDGTPWPMGLVVGVAGCGAFLAFRLTRL